LAKYAYLIPFVALIWNFALPAPVLAASFDCASAKAPREKLICGDATLSELDGQLGRAYQARRALLSPHGADMLQRSELSWLHFITLICPLDHKENNGSLDQPTTCLQRRYQERLTQLAKVGQRLGPFVFNRIDLYAAEPAPDEGGSAGGFYIEHAAYPQIDNPPSPSAEAWNKQSLKTLPTGDDCDAGQGDEDVDFGIGYANERLISVQWSDSVYCHGTPHGMFSSKVANIVLQPVPHPLTEEDLFGTDGVWKEKLKAMFWDALRLKGWKPSELQAESVKAEIEADVIEPEKWLFTEEGLEVSFNAYEGGCYACNPGPVTVPWAKLKPLLLSPTLAP